MKICVVGAGAIGGYLAVRLAGIGEDVSVVIRGANLAAVNAQGMKLINADGSEQVARLRATDRMADLGAQDVVILGMKAHQVAPVVPELATLIGPHTLVVTAQNGIPGGTSSSSAGRTRARASSRSTRAASSPPACQWIALSAASSTRPASWMRRV
jgi:ketopantoate reductase